MKEKRPDKSGPGQRDLSEVSMMELFRSEAETQCGLLSAGLLELERTRTPDRVLVDLMRAAHSIKGAARIINLGEAAQVAHALEDCLVAAQKHHLKPGRAEIDLLLKGVDLLSQLGKCDENALTRWPQEYATEIQAVLHQLTGIRGRRLPSGQRADEPSTPGPGLPVAAEQPKMAATENALPGQMDQASEGTAFPQGLTVRDKLPAPAQAPTTNLSPAERVVRLNAENLNRLLALAGESLVESRWLRPFTESLGRLNRLHTDLAQDVNLLRKLLSSHQHDVPRTTKGYSPETSEALVGAQGLPMPVARQRFTETSGLVNGLSDHLASIAAQLTESRQFLLEKMQELDLYDRRAASLSNRLYLEVLRTRMRPFAEGVRRFPRMVRDVARSLGKEVKLEIFGESTPVDRDILERLETPLAHLLRNAVDHGCETPLQRQRAGKSSESTIRLEARHSAGVLLVTVTDDGAGVNVEQVREAVMSRQLAPEATAVLLGESELLEFLFLPGFSLKSDVTELSGRGVGLDIVQNMVKSVRGAIRVNNQPGRGLRIQLQLPLTLSVVRCLLVEIAGEPYALPLTQLVRALRLARTDIRSLEGRQHFSFGNQQVGLVSMHQLLGYSDSTGAREELSVAVVGDRNARHGLVVDRFLGERELVVQPLDERLGKVSNVSAAALMEDGGPALIVDVDELLRTIETVILDGQGKTLGGGAGEKATAGRQKRVLVVDDSLTVRETERKLLSSGGYLTDSAADGMEAWQAARGGEYDLVITDIDMPRLDGIELASLIKKDPRLDHVKVLIISYKGRETPRLVGLDAGPDGYLAKGSFDDEKLLKVVMELIGGPREQWIEMGPPAANT